MSHDKNIVRDRTLVLRVLVPGLHTSLNDKINSKQDGEDNNNFSSSAAAAAAAASSAGSSMGGSGGGSHNRMSADQLLDLDGVTCLPSSSGSTLWHFRCDGATYPARLVNLPCPVEVHKTHDHANYHKAADVGQMLIVYEDEYAMEEAENEKGYKIDGFPSYYHSGLTPPMRRVVQRRYLSRFEERDTKPVPPPKSEVSEVEKELQDLMAKLSTGKGKQKKTGAATMGKDKVIEEIEEEIVDYEPWMGDGGIFTLDDAKLHPEWWLTKSEMKEIDIAKREAKLAEEEKRRAEEEARLAEEEAARKKAEEKAEKKKKKKDKKKKRQSQIEEETAASAGTPGKKAAGPDGEEVDEVTNAAMMIAEGGDLEDLFGAGEGDDMLDFDFSEDISDLL